MEVNWELLVEADYIFVHQRLVIRLCANCEANSKSKKKRVKEKGRVKWKCIQVSQNFQSKRKKSKENERIKAILSHPDHLLDTLLRYISRYAPSLHTNGLWWLWMRRSALLCLRTFTTLSILQRTVETLLFFHVVWIRKYSPLEHWYSNKRSNT